MLTYQELLQANEAGELLSAKGLVRNIMLTGTTLQEQVDCLLGQVRLAKSAARSKNWLQVVAKDAQELQFHDNNWIAGNIKPVSQPKRVESKMPAGPATDVRLQDNPNLPKLVADEGKKSTDATDIEEITTQIDSVLGSIQDRDQKVEPMQVDVHLKPLHEPKVRRSPMNLSPSKPVAGTSTLSGSRAKSPDLKKKGTTVSTSKTYKKEPRRERDTTKTYAEVAGTSTMSGSRANPTAKNNTGTAVSRSTDSRKGSEKGRDTRTYAEVVKTNAASGYRRRPPQKNRSTVSRHDSYQQLRRDHTSRRFKEGGKGYRGDCSTQKGYDSSRSKYQGRAEAKGRHSSAEFTYRSRKRDNTSPGRRSPKKQRVESERPHKVRVDTSVCPIPGCGESSSRAHAFQEHLPGILDERRGCNQEVTRSRCNLLICCSSRIVGSLDVNILMEYINRLHMLPRGCFGIPRVMVPVLNSLAEELGYPAPTEFTADPLNSPALLMHWRVFLVVLGCMGSEAREELRNNFPLSRYHCEEGLLL